MSDDKDPVTVILPRALKELIERNAAAAERSVAGEIRYQLTRALQPREGQAA